MKCPCGKTHEPQEAGAVNGGTPGRDADQGPGWAVPRDGLVWNRPLAARRDEDVFMNERGRAWGQNWPGDVINLPADRIPATPNSIYRIDTGTGIHEAVEDLTRSVSREEWFAAATAVPFHPYSPIEDMSARGQLGLDTTPMTADPVHIAAVAATWANTVRRRNQAPGSAYTLTNHGPYWFRTGTRQRVGPALTVAARRLGPHPGDGSLDPDRGPERAIRFWVAFERPDHRRAGQFWVLAYGRNWWAEYRNDTSPATEPTFFTCHASAGPATELEMARS